MSKTIKLLSDVELLAAPESEYMSEAQLTSFRQRLLAEESALRGSANATTQHLQVTEAPADPTDRASTEEEHMLELRMRDRERKLLKKIAKALQRIEDRSYGWCEESGEQIGCKVPHARVSRFCFVFHGTKANRFQIGWYSRIDPTRRNR